MARWLVATAIALWGCSSGSGAAQQKPSGATVADCKAEFSASAGYGWESDVTRTSPVGGGTPPPLPPAREYVEAECLDAGQSADVCDQDELMTRDAAMCIATGLGLSTGIAPWTATLTYHHGHERIVWNVDNTLEDDGAGTQSGQFVSIDAIDGSNWGVGSWGSTP